MIKTVIEGLSLLTTPPQYEGKLKAPIVNLNNGLRLDDNMLESPTLLLGSVGSGKTVLLESIMNPIMKHAADNDENVVIFCAKKDFLRYKRPDDIIISVNETDPKGCWNIFSELRASENHELTARDIAKMLTIDQRSEIQPFFENAANDILFNAIECMYADEQRNGTKYTNWHLTDFLNRAKLQKNAEISWFDLIELYPAYFTSDYFGEGESLPQGFGVVSELRTLLHEMFWGSFNSDKGEFSAIESLKTGGKRIFLYYDYANSSEATVKIYRTILNLLLKHSIDAENGRRTWFFLDEASLLPATCIADAMSYGRQSGFRLIMALQSAKLLTMHYKEDDAMALLSLFPNIICLKIQDGMSRSLLSDRYGKCLCTYSFSAPMGKIIQHVEERPVVADYDFSLLKQKGDAICSIPNLSNSPFLYHGYREELDNHE